MILAQTQIIELARRLDDAQTTVTDIASLCDTCRLDLDDAYAIQAALIDLRQRRDDPVSGVKLGFTSAAKMEQMGVSEVIVGRLTAAMRVRDGAAVDLGRYIHPKAEPEIAYRLARDVDPSDPAIDIASCVDAVAPAVEIIDSRYRDFRFTHQDVVADNTSAAGYVLGPWLPMQETADRAVRLAVGHAESIGSTSAILGDPVRALSALRGVAQRRGIPLRAGYIVLAGAATAAIPLTPDPVTCDIDGLGSVSFTGVRQ